MDEVFKAMKRLDFEWKVLTPYNVRVRHRNPGKETFARMSLQLYQVDARSYLLDFTSLIDPSAGTKSRKGSINSRSGSLSSQGEHDSLGNSFGSNDGEARSRGFSNPPINDTTTDVTIDSGEDATTHQTMEFFEMCSKLIGALSR